MKHIINWGAILLCGIVMAGCNSQNEKLVTISNPSTFDRNGEMVEIPLSQLQGIDFTKTVIVNQSTQEEIPFQVTYDDMLIFQASVKPVAQRSMH